MIILQVFATIWCVIVIAWTTGAIYYDVAQRTRWGVLLGALWIVVATAMLVVFFANFVGFIIINVIFLVFLGWWFTQQPAHDREWDANFSKLPNCDISNNQLTVNNVRNTQYRSLDDYDCRFETRRYDLTQLQAVDLLILYWGSNFMCHPMAIFDFGNGDHLCFSIEVRYREGEQYDVLRSIYRQNELMYVVSDERDAILRRTKHSEGHDCYLYRLVSDPAHSRQLLNEYIAATSYIVDHPKWYHLITSNCTTMIYWQRHGRLAWDWRILFNGTLDKMLYQRQRLFQGLPFDELKHRSLINESANRASEQDFGQEIRAGLPGFGTD